VFSSPTVVSDPESGDSIGSRVMLGTLGHRKNRADRATGPSPASFAVSIEEATGTQAGEPLRVTIDIENTGGIIDTRTVELSAGDFSSNSTELSLEGGERTTETLLLSTDDGDTGRYTLTVETVDSEATETVRVSEPSSSDNNTSDGSGPGFGVGGALAGVGGAGYLLKRRFSDEDSE
jgi:PGF-CTERM protein